MTAHWNLPRLLAWAVFAAVVAWSVWFFVERWWPLRCFDDGCPVVVGTSPPLERVLRYGLWLAAVAFAVRAVGMPDPTPRRVAVAAATAAACFVAVLVTLGGVFPPLPRMLPGL